MSLTREDLQAIGSLMDSKLDPIKADVAGLKTDVSGLKTDVSAINTRLDKLEEGQSVMNTRLDKMETDIADVKHTQQIMETTLDAVKMSQFRVENEIVPKIKAALDGHVDLYRNSKSHETRLDSLEKRVDHLEVKAV